MFTYKIDLIISNVVVTIGRNYPIPKGIVTVNWSWTDYEVEIHINKMNNLPYFPYSPFNIPSATALAKSMNYDEVK